MSAEPLVSVVVCVFNAGEFLLPAIASLQAQTHRNLEILIVNDGSTDGCVDPLRRNIDGRIRIIDQPNRGKPVALNRALDEITGEYYAIQDADDLSLPTRIQTQLKCLTDHPELAAVYCGHELLLDGQQVAPTFSAKSAAVCKRYIDRFQMPAHDPTGMYRRSMVGDLQYCEGLKIGQGLDYVLRVGERHLMVVVGECLYVYRIHGDSATKRNPELRNRMVDEVHRRACRRRGLNFEQTFPKPFQPGEGNSQTDNNLAAHFMSSVCDLRKAGRRGEALSTGLFCSRLHPRDLHYHKALAYALMPQTLVDWTRGRRRETALAGR